MYNQLWISLYFPTDLSTWNDQHFVCLLLNGEEKRWRIKWRMHWAISLCNWNDFRLLLRQFEIASTAPTATPSPPSNRPLLALVQFEPFVRISCCLCLQAKFIHRRSSPAVISIVMISVQLLWKAPYFLAIQPVVFLLLFSLLPPDNAGCWWENGCNNGNTSLISIIRIYSLASTWQRKVHSTKKCLHLERFQRKCLNCISYAIRWYE